jgi:hypothetical protein
MAIIIFQAIDVGCFELCSAISQNVIILFIDTKRSLMKSQW